MDAEEKSSEAAREVNGFITEGTSIRLLVPNELAYESHKAQQRTEKVTLSIYRLRC